MSNLTLGSLFDGSGGFPLGAFINGITPIWASEVEPFPIRVTTKRFQSIKHYGDICRINGAEIEPVDIITFGSPCTDLSVAGKRAGLEGKQSSLFHEAIRVIKEMRCKTDGKYPRFIVWENVPGAFSSGKGEDFKAVINEIAKIKDETAYVPMPEKDKWLSAGEFVADDYSIAWRVLDSQYWGVPQRRRRIYLVADFASECAGKILFEFESLSGYSPKSIKPRETITGDAKDCIGETISFEPGAASRLGGHYWENSACTLRADMGDNQLAVAIENHPADSRIGIDDTGTIQTLTGRMGTGGGNVPLVMNERQYALTVGDEVANTLTGTDYKGVQCVFEPKAYGICSDKSNAMLSDNPKSGIYEADTSRTIDGTGGNPSCNQGGIAIVESYSLQGSMIGRKDENGPNGDGINKEVSFTLNTTDKHSVCTVTGNNPTQINKNSKDLCIERSPIYAIDREAFNCGQNFARKLGIVENGVASTLNAQGPSAVAWDGDSVSPTLTAKNAGGNQRMPDKGNFNSIVEPNYTVRRLTPTECALLQGFSEEWCSNLETPNPTDEEIEWWSDIFETHRKINGTSNKSKSRSQIIKWLQNPYSDSAEYKMWGNGVALPCVCFVLAGIVWSDNNLKNE
jgi:DNA (cytosine-5)-methyltransferase 1